MVHIGAPELGVGARRFNLKYAFAELHDRDIERAAAEIDNRDAQLLPKPMEFTPEELSALLLQKIKRDAEAFLGEPVVQAFHDAGLQFSQIDRLIFVGGPTHMPSVRAFFEELIGKKAESGVDPMECVAQGAAVQAGVLAGEVGNIVLVDVTPLTLGIETLGNIATPLIARNTPIPVKRSEIFTTAADLQTSVTIDVFQGERPMVSDNVSLGRFNLDGLPPAPRGVPRIEVMFDIGTDGILNAAAKDMASGRSQSIRITVRRGFRKPRSGE